MIRISVVLSIVLSFSLIKPSRVRPHGRTGYPVTFVDRDNLQLRSFFTAPSDLVDHLLAHLLDFADCLIGLALGGSLSLPVNTPAASLILPFTSSALPPMIATPVTRAC